MNSASKHSKRVPGSYAEQLQILLHNIPTQVWYLSDDHTYGTVNKAHAEFNGKNIEDISFSKIPEEIFLPWHKVFKDAFSSDEPIRTEELIQNSSGKYRLLSITKSPCLRKDGSVEYVVCSAEDITEQHIMQEDLRQSEQNFRATLENLYLGVVVHASDSSILLCNPAARRILGLTIEQMKGKQAIDPVWKFVYEDLSPIPVDDYPVNRVLLSNEPLTDYLLGVQRPDRDHITWVIVNALPIFTKIGELEKVIVNFTDITERKHAEAALRIAEEKFRTMYDNAPLSYQSLDSEGCFLDVNPNWLKTLGYLREEVIGKNFRDFLHPESKEHFAINFPAFKKRGFVHDVQFRIRHKDGHYVDISFEGCVGYNDDKSFKQTYCVFQDITEKVLTEKAFQKSQNLLRNIFENSTNLYYSHTPDHVITYMSPQVEEMLGYTLEEAKVIWMELASDNPINETGFENTVRAIETGERQPPYELELVRKDGKKIWVEIREFPEVVSGKTIAMLGSLTEITQRRRAVEELKSSEERFRLLYENSPDMYVSVSAEDGSILRCNKTLLDKTGYSHNEIIGSSIFNMYHADALYGAHEAFEQFVSTGRVTDKELILKRKDCSKLPVSLNVSAVKDKAGKILHSISSWRDISQRKQAEESVRESEEKFRTIFENKGTATGLFGEDGVIQDCNAVFCELSGYSREEIIGSSWSDYIVTEDLERLQKYNSERTKKGSSAPAQYECRMIARHNRFVDVLVNIAVIEETRIVSLVDITDRKKANQEIQRMQRLEGLGTIAGGIAHDFNNLLTGIFANLEMAKMDLPANCSSSQYLQEAHHSILSARRLTGQLLTFAKGGAPVFKIVDMTRLIKETIDFNLHGTNVVPEIELQDNLWSIMADEGQVEQVLANLTINSKQAMPGGGVLHVAGRNLPISEAYSEADLSSDSVLFTIRDEGIGIPSKIIDHIFDPYFSTKETGHGLGLAIVYSIIKQHRGHISVTSEPNTGTTFTIILPAIPEAGRDIAQEADRAQGKTGVKSSFHILLMDDEEIVRNVGTQLLERLGHTTDTAVHGDEALKKYTEGIKTGKPFDLVIMDLTIRGGKGGKETIGELLEIHPDAKVIVSSGYSSGSIMANFSSYGFSGKLAKPFMVSDLQDAIVAVMNSE